MALTHEETLPFADGIGLYVLAMPDYWTIDDAAGSLVYFEL
jgi:hypothetical protein